MVNGHSKWMNEEQVLEWLGVSRSFMNKYAKEKKLNISYLNGKRGKMYDRLQIEAILDNNSMEQYIQEITSH